MIQFMKFKSQNKLTLGTSKTAQILHLSFKTQLCTELNLRVNFFLQKNKRNCLIQKQKCNITTDLLSTQLKWNNETS